MAGHSHRSSLKGNHKPFKSKHASKGQLKNQYKGKVEKSAGNGKTIKSLSKFERKNIAKQLKLNKIYQSNLARTLFEGSNAAEKIITIIGLTDDILPAEIAARLVNSVKDSPEDDDTIFDVPSVNDVTINRFKSKLKIILPDPTNLIEILDSCKISDFVIIGVSAQKEVEETYGEQILRAIIAQGVASIVGVLPNVVSAYPKRNLQQDIKQSLFSFFTHFFPSEEKLYSIEADSDALNCIRTICQKFPKSVTWRDSRGYILSDNAFYSERQLIIEGTVRGIGFNTNRLIHIPGYGDFQIDQIEKLITGNPKKADIKEIEPDSNVFTSNENQEPLEDLNPEEVEMSGDESSQTDAKGVRLDGHRYFEDQSDVDSSKKRVPKGTSEYQARWYLEDVVEEGEESEDGDSDDMIEENEDEDEDDMDVEDSKSEYGTVNGDNESEMFVELSDDEEARQLAEFRRKEEEDREFPDEIELLPNMSAKDELSRYRGVRSLASYDWDCDEFDPEAPSEWLRLLRISNFKATRNRITKQGISEAQVTQGNKVRLFVKDPNNLLENVDINTSKKPFVVYSLLEHEHKSAVVNFSIESWENYEKPIVSGETIIVQYGPRRQVINPEFSQGSNNPNNVHKFERFLHQNTLSIATCIAPVLFNNAPAIFFKQTVDGVIELVGQGTFLNCDHTRVIAERAVLTGEPFKIHKNVVTIRYMFFNADDVNWYKAIPLFTKMGRSGFIKESLGTHGYFKATFDGKLNAQDTIAMSLYKRVWPKNSITWSGQPTN